MDLKITVALIGLTGVLASVATQFFLARSTEKNKKAIEVRTNAYLDLINAVAELATSGHYGKQREQEQLAKLTQAKSRVVLIGSRSVVISLHHHLKTMQTFQVMMLVMHLVDWWQLCVKTYPMIAASMCNWLPSRCFR